MSNEEKLTLKAMTFKAQLRMHKGSLLFNSPEKRARRRLAKIRLRVGGRIFMPARFDQTSEWVVFRNEYKGRQLVAVCGK
jgi:hypothetical protein